MNYINELNIDLNQKSVITVTGSGGKTTMISQLADQLLVAGKRIVITTTTHIYLPEANNAITILSGSVLAQLKLQYQGIVFAGKSIDSNNKLQGFSNEEISLILKNPNIDFLIIEGDGSKKLPLKGYASYEPVVPDTTDILISIIGLNALGNVVSEESVHRIDKFEKITGKTSGATIEKQDIVKLILSPNGYFKSRGKKNYLILNQVNDNIYHVASAIKDELEKKSVFIDKIIINGEVQ
jgi:probable selenium-dependent hydroxylase accessory protein YqeC